MKRGGLTLGWGMAGCSWLAERFPCAATVELRDDGTARVSCATQDIGTGTYTVLAQIAAEKLGLPLDKVEVVLGDTHAASGSDLRWIDGDRVRRARRPGGGGKGDRFVAGIGRPIARLEVRRAKAADSRIQRRTRSRQGRPGCERHCVRGRACGCGNVRAVSGIGSSEGSGAFGTAKPTFSSHSFGAHFVEVTWQPEIARLRVSRVVTVIDAGRILNPLAGRNQIEGAVVMGIGMALFEETSYDPRNGAPINANLADYIVAVNADVPSLEVHFLEYPDTKLNELGARGIGEIGLAGMARGDRERGVPRHRRTGPRAADQDREPARLILEPSMADEEKQVLQRSADTPMNLPLQKISIRRFDFALLEIRTKR